MTRAFETQTHIHSPGLTPLAHTGRVSSFLTLQRSQKLDAYGSRTAGVHWTIGPRVCAAEGPREQGSTVPYSTRCTSKYVWLHASRAAARLQAAPPAVAPGLRLQAKEEAACRSGLDTDLFVERNSRAIEIARHGVWIGLDGDVRYLPTCPRPLP